MPATKLSAADLSAQAQEDRFKARGISFVLRELSIDDYDELIEKHTTTNEQTGEEQFDSAAFLRDLTRKSLVRPKWVEVPRGTRLVRMLEQRARDLHTGVEPVAVEGEEEDEEDASEAPQDA